jgi:hypothetical protein
VIAATGLHANRNRWSEQMVVVRDQGDKARRDRGHAQDQGPPAAVRDIQNFADHGGHILNGRPLTGREEIIRANG